MAAQNVADYHLQDWIQLIQSDLYDAVAPGQYDLILSNPPYVNSSSMAALPPEYQHEPQLALAAQVCLEGVPQAAEQFDVERGVA